jgi:hypothetical protein
MYVAVTYTVGNIVHGYKPVRCIIALNVILIPLQFYT